MSIQTILKTLVFPVALISALYFQLLHSTPLIDAIKKGEYNNVESLLKNRASIDERDSHGFTPVWLATNMSGHFPAMMKILYLILQYNPDLDLLVNGQTALMNAIRFHNWKAADLLLAHNSDLEQKDNHGETALMMAHQIAENSSGLTRQEALKLVDLLSSRMKNPEKLSISPKSCYVSFEQEDDGVIAKNLKSCIFMQINAIVAPQLLKELFKKYPSVQEDCKNGKITCLASQFKLADGAPQLVVIIPSSLDSLGLRIPDSEKQNIEQSIDISALENKFGFKNLKLLNPAYVSSVIVNVNAANHDEFKTVLENFSKIINVGSPNHPTRFYLDGHGMKGIVASIPVDLFENFFSQLSEIGTEFIYIESCHTVANIPRIQSSLAAIITKQIEESMKSKTAPFPGIDYAIVIQATSDVSTSGFGFVKDMFTKLDKFLQDPVWALEFGPGVNRPKITIADVIAALGFPLAESLPSIRLPGKSGFFRSLNVGSMEIISESRVVEEGVKRTLELFAESKSVHKAIADEATRKLQGNLDIEIPIKPTIQFVQIFPMGLLDFNFVLEAFPKFISCLSGQGQHYIGKITARVYDDIKQLINKSFSNIFEMNGGYRGDRCWFIKFVDMQKTKTIIKKLAIHLFSDDEGKQRVEYAYINEKGYHIVFGNFTISKRGAVVATVLSETASESIVDNYIYESKIRQWFSSTLPTEQTLKEATGGIEITAQEKARLLRQKNGSQALKLIEPRFARTPEDLFNMFMAD